MAHWRAPSGFTDEMTGTANGPMRRAVGWALSFALTVSTIALAWRFHV